MTVTVNESGTATATADHSNLLHIHGGPTLHHTLVLAEDVHRHRVPGRAWALVVVDGLRLVLAVGVEGPALPVRGIGTGTTTEIVIETATVTEIAIGTAYDVVLVPPVDAAGVINPRTVLAHALVIRVGAPRHDAAIITSAWMVWIMVLVARLTKSLELVVVGLPIQAGLQVRLDLAVLGLDWVVLVVAAVTGGSNVKENANETGIGTGIEIGESLEVRHPGSAKGTATATATWI